MAIKLTTRYGWPGAVPGPSGEDPPPPPPGDARFAGDPGAGNIILGSSVRNGDQSRFTDLVGAAKLNRPIGCVRVYDSNGVTRPNGVDWARIDWHRSQGRIVFTTITPNQHSTYFNGWDDVATIGDTVFNNWADEMAAKILARAPWPIWIVWQHEPSRHIAAGTLTTHFRAAKRRIHQALRARGCHNYAHGDCAHTTWVFRTNSSGNHVEDYRLWMTDFKGVDVAVGTPETPSLDDFYTGVDANGRTSLANGRNVDFWAQDLYINWGHPPGSGVWQSFQAQHDDSYRRTGIIYPATGARAVPHVMAEFGHSAYCGNINHGGTASNPGPYACDNSGYSGWTAANRTQVDRWWDEAYPVWLQRNVAAAMYFSSFDTPINLDNQDPNKWRLAAFRRQIDRATTRLPSSYL